MKKENFDKNMLIALKIIIYILAVAVIILAVTGPFILDCLYGSGILDKLYKNSFSAETWFSFIGSYFPATIIGIITLYQAHIIQKQDKRYKELMNRHRFVPISHADIYRYAEKNHTIGNYTSQKISQMLWRTDKGDLLDEWTQGYIMECGIYSNSEITISKINVSKIEWEINGQMHTQRNENRISGSVERISNSKQRLILFWLFDDEAADEIAQAMLYEYRRDSRYENTEIIVTLQGIDSENEVCDLKLRYQLQSLKDNYKMSSVEENIYVMWGKKWA